MKLQGISVSGFKSLRDVRDIHLSSPTILAGHNDAGKSTIIRSIQFLLGEYIPNDRDLSFLGPSEPEDGRSELGEGRVSKIQVEGIFGLRPGEMPDHEGESVRVRRSWTPESGAISEIFKSVPRDERLRDLGSKKVADLRPLCSEILPDSSATDKASMVEALSEHAETAEKELAWVSMTSSEEAQLPHVFVYDSTQSEDVHAAVHGSLAAAFKTAVREKKLQGKIKEIEGEIKEVLADPVSAIENSISEELSEVAAASVNLDISLSTSSALKGSSIELVDGEGRQISLTSMGAGKSRRAAMAIWRQAAQEVMDSDRDVVFLYDEPDANLDYHRQREFIRNIVDDGAVKNAVTVVASHSMNLIDGVDISDVIHVRQEDFITSIEVLGRAEDCDPSLHLGEIASSVGLRNTTLLHERLFVGVEGDSEARVLPRLFRLVHGKHLESYGIALWPAGNNEGARHFAAYLKNRQRNMAFVVDRDSLSNSNTKKIFRSDSLRAVGFNPDEDCYYLGEQELEDCFPDELWADLANAKWPRNSRESPLWTAADFADCRSGKFSSNLLEMVKVGSLTGPQSKPEIMDEMGQFISDSKQVPDEIQEVFKRLIERAR